MLSTQADADHDAGATEKMQTKRRSKRLASSLTTSLTSPFFFKKNNDRAPKKSRQSASAAEAGTVQKKKNAAVKKSPRKQSVVPKTKSFDAVVASRFASLRDKNIPIHTLILGTHPSEASLSEQQYYKLNTNAFWWIAGDCLGFRRAPGYMANQKDFLNLTQHLRHGLDKVIPYEEQLEMLCSKGFALWDLVHSCRRVGSSDSNIRDSEPNDIRSLCRKHPTIRRIVLSNGSASGKLFRQLHRDWIATGEVVAHASSQRYFGKKTAPSRRRIVCIVAAAVSPAAARMTYVEKRDFWEEHVYGPGLKDFEAAKLAAAVVKGGGDVEGASDGGKR